MRCQLEQAHVEAHRAAVALGDCRAQVVVEQMSRASLKVRECVHMPAQEILDRLVQEEAQEDPARESQRQDECGERTARGANRDVAEAGPVHLSLFGAKRATDEECLARKRTQRLHPVSHLAHRERAAPLAKHVPQSRRPQPRILLQRLAGKAHEGIEAARPRCRPHPRLVPECSLYGLVVQAQLRRDRPHRPVLAVVKLANPGHGLEFDHQSLLLVGR